MEVSYLVMAPTVQHSWNGDPCPYPQGLRTGQALSTGQALCAGAVEDRLYEGQYPEPLAGEAGSGHAAPGISRVLP